MHLMNAIFDLKLTIMSIKVKNKSKRAIFSFIRVEMCCICVENQTHGFDVYYNNIFKTSSPFNLINNLSCHLPLNYISRT